MLMMDTFFAGQIESHPMPNLKTQNLNSAKAEDQQEGSNAKFRTQSQNAACATMSRAEMKDAESAI